MFVVIEVTNRMDIIVRILRRSIEDLKLSGAHDMDDPHLGVE